MVHNRQFPMKSLAFAHRNKASAVFDEWQNRSASPIAHNLSSCYLRGSSRTYRITVDVSVALLGTRACRGMSALDMQIMWRERGSACVCGVLFWAGEPLEGVLKTGWANRRCGSVCTAVIKARGERNACSRYARIRKFIERVDGVGGQYAVVEWLPKPTYPYSHPLVVCLQDGDQCGDGLPVLLPLGDIDPCLVMIERDDSEDASYVYRLEGLDVMP